MITRVGKASSELLDRIATLILANDDYRVEVFSSTDKATLIAALRKLGPEWTILTQDQTLALFTLTETEGQGVVDHLCLSTPEAITGITSELTKELQKTPITTISITTHHTLAERLMSQGFIANTTLTNFSSHTSETQFMPILPLMNPDNKDIPILAKLMHEAYAKNKTPKYANADAAATRLRRVIQNGDGQFLPDCSFVSGLGGNYVSACFITSSSPGTATISELFTHPLYRARGLATSEIATARNRLAKRNYSTLNVWIDETNDVACRLFTKLGFQEKTKKMTLSKKLK
jgi:GNAT superfamily N-acetyltransferase